MNNRVIKFSPLDVLEREVAQVVEVVEVLRPGWITTRVESEKPLSV